PFGLALAAAFIFAAVVMAIVAWAAERLVLRKLVNQEGIILFMATIGMTFFIEGLAQTLFGADVYPLNIGLPKEPIFILESLFDGGILVNELDIWAAVIAGLLVAGLALFFQRTRIGRALRAVADDHAAAQSVGIPLNQIWFIVWLVAGLVALVAGAVWGSKLGVQFSLTLLALLVIAFYVVPFVATEYVYRAVLIPTVILALAAIGLNVLMGYCGQVSLGSGAFMGVGAYAAYTLAIRLPFLNPFVCILLSG